MIKQDYMDDSPEISLVQNRLTAAGLVLTSLFFSGSFSLGLYSQLTKKTMEEFRIDFVQVLTPLAFGATFAILAVAGLLLCQQLSPQSQRWVTSRRWWFSVSTIWIYLAASQAMSSGLIEVVFSVAQVSQFVANVIATLALPGWILLLFVAPTHVLYRAAKRMSPSEWRSMLVVYTVPLLSIILTTAQIYTLKAPTTDEPYVFLKYVLWQLVQPLSWPHPW